jgi:hypothetical protein
MLVLIQLAVLALVWWAPYEAVRRGEIRATRGLSFAVRRRVDPHAFWLIFALYVAFAGYATYLVGAGLLQDLRQAHASANPTPPGRTPQRP